MVNLVELWGLRPDGSNRGRHIKIHGLEADAPLYRRGVDQALRGSADLVPYLLEKQSKDRIKLFSLIVT